MEVCLPSASSFIRIYSHGSDTVNIVHVLYDATLNGGQICAPLLRYVLTAKQTPCCTLLLNSTSEWEGLAGEGPSKSSQHITSKDNKGQ